MRASLALALAAVVAAGSAARAQPGPAAPLSHHIQTVKGDRISVEVMGEGPDIVLIPGLASSRDVWMATAARLAGHYRLHLVQVAGFAGEPAGANAGPVVVPTAEAIDAYIVSQHLAPATVVGHSLGGTMILWLAEHHPDHLKKALIVDALPWVAQVFVSPTVTMEQATKVAEAIRIGPPQPETAETRMIASMVTGETDRATVLRWTKASDPKTVSNALADDMELDLRPGLGVITTPITLIYPFDAAMGIPGAAWDQVYAGAFAPAHTVKLERVDGARHFVMLDQPAAFAADLDAFLAK